MHAERLGKYELIRHLASGGMAQVYLARLSGPGGFARHLVLKTLLADQRAEQAYTAMFLDEARLVATLHHQHIAQVFEVGQADDGRYFLAMEYVHGETVRHALEVANARGVELPLDFGLTVVCAAAAGLHHAHERRGPDGAPLGIVHRDVSPSNLIVSYDGSVKLIDFGIAKAEGRATRTASGFVKGKTGYMAPEQARGYEVDRRSDVFALGVLAYELTTQTRAFHGESQFETVERTVRGIVERPSRVVAGYPAALEDVVMTALEPDPDDRFQDAETMRRELEQVASDLGLVLGTTAISRVLDRLFGARPEPWLAIAQADADDDAPTPVIAERLPAPAIDLVDLTTRPFARDDEPPAIVHRASVTRPLAPVRPPVLPSWEAPPRVAPRPPAMAATALLPPPPPLPVVPVPVPIAPVPAIAPARAPSSPGLAVPASAIAALVTVPRASTQNIAAAPRGARWQLAAAVGALALVGGTIAALLAYGGDDAPPARSPARPSATRPRTSPVLAPAAPAPASRPAPPAPPAERAAADTVMLRVTSDPVGATVVLDGVRLGTTPFAAPVHVKPGLAWLKVRKRHRVPVPVRVSLEHDVEWTVQLHPLHE